jgi:hypothetical protein
MAAFIHLFFKLSKNAPSPEINIGNSLLCVRNLLLKTLELCEKCGFRSVLLNPERIEVLNSSNYGSRRVQV